METKLTDFTSKELQTLLNAVVFRELEFSARINSRRRLFEKADAAYPLHLKEVADEHQELETVRLWHTQILTAIGTVGALEAIADS